MSIIDKTPLRSKKFIAYLLAEISWKIILVIALLVMKDQISSVNVGGWWFLFTIVIVVGFVEVGFIGGQAWLDKYVRVAQIASNGKPPAAASED
jgi:hypothetical protein